jgi:hypothetical protein
MWWWCGGSGTYLWSGVANVDMRQVLEETMGARGAGKRTDTSREGRGREAEAQLRARLLQAVVPHAQLHALHGARHDHLVVHRAHVERGVGYARRMLGRVRRLVKRDVGDLRQCAQRAARRVSEY